MGNRLQQPNTWLIIAFVFGTITVLVCVSLLYNFYSQNTVSDNIVTGLAEIGVVTDGDYQDVHFELNSDSLEIIWPVVVEYTGKNVELFIFSSRGNQDHKFYMKVDSVYFGKHE